MNPTSTPDISRYCDQMEEIKRRIAAVDFFICGAGHALFNLSTVESSYLQIRKILELIAMASLVANKKKMQDTYSGFEKSWNAELLFKDLARVNPHFYPYPVVETPSADPDLKNTLSARENDYLNQDEFIRLYKKCGSILHADNPFGRKTNYPSLKSQIPDWRTKIVNLLNNHMIQLPGDENIYIVHMKEDRDDKVHAYTLVPASSVNDLNPLELAKLARLKSKGRPNKSNQ